MSGAMFIILYITGSCMKFLRYLVYLYYYIDCLVYVLSMCFRDILSVATVKDQFPVLGSVIEVSLARCALYGGVVGYVGKAAKTPSPKCALEMDVTAPDRDRDFKLHWQSHWRLLPVCVFKSLPGFKLFSIVFVSSPSIDPSN